MNGKIVRLFISSTFNDFAVERNVLREYVFPRLKQLCESYGAKFHPIDLRWGVRQKDALSQQTLKICLNEIKRCQELSLKPNFLILLGNRFGWQAAPAEIPIDEWQQIYKIADEKTKIKLNEWYKLDSNQSPPCYILLSREENAVDDQVWQAEENELRNMLRSIIPTLGWQEDDQRKRKYFSSATQLEIFEGALDTDYTSDNITCVIRSIKGLPKGNNLEKAKKYVDFNEQQGKIDAYAQSELSVMRDSLVTRFPESILHYESNWTGETISYDHIESFIEDIYGQMHMIIKKQLEAIDPIQFVNDEKKEHANFSKKQVLYFTGREAALKRIDNYLLSEQPFPLIIHGPSGCGKSALLAKASERFIESNRNHVVIRRFVSATSLAYNAETIVEIICKELDELFQQSGEMDAKNLEQWIGLLQQRLHIYAPIKPIVLFLDALNQLTHSTQAFLLVKSLAKLPANVHVVLSCTTEFLSHLQGLIHEDFCYRVEDMSNYEATLLLNQWLKNDNSSLQIKQHKYILKQFKKNPYPLYLRLSFDVAKEWKSWEIHSIRPTNRGIIEDRLQFLENHHGKLLTTAVLSSIALSRYGLTDEEIYGLISEDPLILDEFREHSPDSPQFKVLPMVIYARFFADLASYLTEHRDRDTRLINFYHGEFYHAVMIRYNLHEQPTLYHQKLATYFEGLPLVSNYRKLVEQPYQQIHANRWELLVEKTLGNLEFLVEKINLELLLDVQFDFKLVFSFNQLPKKTKHILQVWNKFIHQELHVLAKYPTLAFQQAANSSLDLVQAAAKQLTISRPSQKKWFQLLTKSKYTPGLIRQFVEDHSYFGNGYFTGFINDSKYVFVAGGPNVKVWDAKTSELLHVLDEKWETIFDFSISDDGKHCVTVHRGMAVLWNLEKFTKVNERLTISVRPRKMQFSNNGDLLAISAGNQVLIYETKTGSLIKEIQEHDKELEFGRISWSSNDQYIALINNRCEIVIWTMNSKEVFSKLENNKQNNDQYRIYQCVWLKDTPKMILCNIWGTVFQWDLFNKPVPIYSIENSVKVKRLSSHTNHQFIVQYDVGTVLKWDLLKENGDIIVEKQGDDYFYKSALSPDAKWLVLANEVKLEVWNLFSKKQKAFINLDTSISSINWDKESMNFLTVDHFGIAKFWKVDELYENNEETFKPLQSLVSNKASNLLVTYNGETIQLWDKTTGKVDKQFKAKKKIYEIAVSSRGQIAIVSGGQLFIDFIDYVPSIVGPINDLTWSIDGKQVAIIGQNEVSLYDPLTKSHKSNRVLNDSKEKLELVTFNNHLIVNVNSTNGDRYNRENQLIHSEAGHISTLPEYHVNRYIETFSSHNHIVVGSEKGVTILWDGKDATENIAKGQDFICSASSTSGKWIALVNEQSQEKFSITFSPPLTLTLQIWDTFSKHKVSEITINSTGLLNGGRNPGSAFLFFNDNTPYLVHTKNYGGSGPITEIWNGKTGELVGQILGRIYEDSQLSPNLQMVVATDSNLFRLYSTDTWTEIASFPAFSINRTISWGMDNQTICLGHNGQEPVFVRLRE